MNSKRARQRLDSKASPFAFARDSSVGLSRYRWPEHLLDLLGKIPDQTIAQRARVCIPTVIKERRRRRISPFRPLRQPVKWTAPMIQRLGKASDAEVGAELGIRKASVRYKRHLLAIPPYSDPASRGHGYPWNAWAVKLLGKASDKELAKKLGVSTATVFMKRRELGIASFGRAPKRFPWTKKTMTMIGTRPDKALAKQLDTTKTAVAWKRIELGRPAFPYRPPKRIARTVALRKILKLPNRLLRERHGMARSTASYLRAEMGIPTPDGRNLRWTAKAIARLGKEPDSAIAARVGITADGVAAKRKSLGIPSHRRLHRWTSSERVLFWKMSDREIAKHLRLPVTKVRWERRWLGIALPDRR